jgi:hypothetical protein
MDLLDKAKNASMVMLVDTLPFCDITGNKPSTDTTLKSA